MPRKKNHRKKSMSKIMEELEAIMGPHGRACGEEIVEVARRLHGDNVLFAMPLYRSALIVLKKTPEEEKRGSCTIILYHDPHWMGHDTIDEENLPGFKDVLQVWGQRSGPDLTLNGHVLAPEPDGLTQEGRIRQGFIDNLGRRLNDEKRKKKPRKCKK